MPAETGEHERTLMCWPARDDLYGELMVGARRAHAELATFIASFEPVTMIASPQHAEDAVAQCGPGVDVVAIPIDDSWARDSGPIYVTGDDGGRTALDFRFNGWGGKFEPCDDDDALARRWAHHAEHAVHRVDMVLEGGAIAVDGAGTLVTTEQCLLHPNRNPDMTRTEIEAVLTAELGVPRVVWLPYGLALDDDTDGHVDNIAAFPRAGVLLMQGCDDEREDDWLRCDVNVRTARGAPDAAGTPLDVVVVPTLPFTEIGGRRVAVPYLNAYAGNGFVAVPVCGHAADDEMVALIAEQYPGRTVAALDIGAVLAYGGGGIHCITQQVPALYVSGLQGG